MFLMTFQKLIKILPVIGGALTAAGCSPPPPYVLIDGEFDRESVYYRDGIPDRREVKVCYAKRGTTAREVAALAQRECALVAKKAVFREQNFQICPFVTPMAAVYECVENPTASSFRNTYNLPDRRTP